jgi:AraC-like DNA-binding protein
MLGSALSEFSKAAEFQAALRESSDADVIATSGRNFWARITQIWLLNMRLLRCEERVSRIAFISVKPNVVRVTLPPKPDASLLWDGISAQLGEIVTHSAGHRFHERADGPCRWSTLFLSAKDLLRAGRATQGTAFILPPGEHRWRPTPDVLRSVINLHADAINATEMRPRLPVEREAAHGLEQQLTLAVIECLVNENTDHLARTDRHRADVMIRFEDVLRTSPLATLTVTDIALALGVSNAVLRKYCHAHLGMAPGRYLLLRRMGLVLQALYDSDPAEATVERIMRLHGFSGSGHFAEAYHSTFGELPSVTLRRVRLR